MAFGLVPKKEGGGGKEASPWVWVGMEIGGESVW